MNGINEANNTRGADKNTSSSMGKFGNHVILSGTPFDLTIGDLKKVIVEAIVVPVGATCTVTGEQIAQNQHGAPLQDWSVVLTAGVYYPNIRNAVITKTAGDFVIIHYGN